MTVNLLKWFTVAVTVICCASTTTFALVYDSLHLQDQKYPLPLYLVQLKPVQTSRSYRYCSVNMAFMESFLQLSSTGTCICCLLLLLVVYLLFFSSQRDENEPPGPKPLPLLGNLLMLDVNKPHLSLCEVSMNEISPVGQQVQLCFYWFISKKPWIVDKPVWWVFTENNSVFPLTGNIYDCFTQK